MEDRRKFISNIRKKNTYSKNCSVCVSIKILDNGKFEKNNWKPKEMYVKVKHCKVHNRGRGEKGSLLRKVLGNAPKRIRQSGRLQGNRSRGINTTRSRSERIVPLWRGKPESNIVLKAETAEKNNNDKENFRNIFNVHSNTLRVWSERAPEPVRP